MAGSPPNNMMTTIVGAHENAEANELAKIFVEATRGRSNGTVFCAVAMIMKMVAEATPMQNEATIAALAEMANSCTLYVAPSQGDPTI